MKRDKNLAWRRVDAASLDLKGCDRRRDGRHRARLQSFHGIARRVGQDSDVSGMEFIKADLSLMRVQRVAAVLRRLT